MRELISRQAALDAIKACDDGHGFVWLDGVRAVLTLLPSVQERNGRWIRKKDEKINAWWWECSECGKYPLKSVFNRQDDLSEYCPHCGASMTEGAEDAGREH